MTSTTRLSDLTGDYVLDTARSRIGFIARHTIGTTVDGQAANFAGSARLDGDNPSRSSAALTVEVGSIQTGNPRRDAPLRGKFLDAGNHPSITFTSTAVEQIDETTFRVAGGLNLRGVTRPVNLNVRLTGVETDQVGELRVRFAGGATINRKDWGVHWNAAIGVVSKTVALYFDVVVFRRS